MKKTILLIVTLIALALAAFSQGTVYAKYAKYGEKNDRDSFYFKDDYKYAGVTFTMRGDSIKGDDDSHSVYRIKSRGEIQNDGQKEIQDFYCTDEKDRNCSVTTALYNNGERYLIVVYFNYAIIYKIESKINDK